MQKFRKMLQSSNSEIKAARAKLISEEAVDAMNEILRDKRKKKRDLEKQLLSLGDLHQDSELSLRVVKNDFNAKKWLDEIYATKLNLLEATIELQAAEEMYGEWFDEEESDETTLKTSDEKSEDLPK